MMNQDWFKDVLMITKMMTKVMTKSSKVNQRMSSRFKRKVDFKNQESRFKDQASKNQDQDWRIKRRLNQGKYEKVFSKTE